MGRTLRDAALLAIQPLALNVISVPVLAYIIRRLGPEGYAQWMTATSLLAVCAAITNPGLRGAFIRHIAADASTTRAALADQLGLRLVLAGVAGAIVATACLLLNYPGEVLRCAAVGAAGLALTTISTTFADVLQSSQRVRTLACVNLIAGLTLTGASVVAAHWRAAPVTMALAYLTGPALSAVLMLAIVHRGVCPVAVRCDVRRAWDLLVRSRHFAAQQLLSAGSAQAEALMLPRLIGMVQYGFFSAGSMIPSRLSVLPDGLCTAAYPAMVRACARDSRPAGTMVFRFVAVAAIGGTLVTLAGVLASDPVGRLLFPAQPSVFTGIVRITLWSLPLVGVEMVLACALNAAGKDGTLARASLPGAAVSLLMCVALVTHFGMAGACWSILLRPTVRIAFLAPLAFRTFRSAHATTRHAGEPFTPLAAPLLRKAG